MILKNKQFYKQTIVIVFCCFFSFFSHAQDIQSQLEKSESVTMAEDEAIISPEIFEDEGLEFYEDGEEIIIDEDLEDKPEDIPEDDATLLYLQPRRINEIIIHGNKYTSTDAILSHIPYKIGEIFDPRKTRLLIQNLYYSLKRFRNITVKGQNVGKGLINLYVIVEEKKPLKEVRITGNKQVSDKEIAKKVNFEEIHAVDAEELKTIAQQIKQVYLEKGYHMTDIETELQIDEDDRAIALFTIHEGKRSIVKQVHFVGNKNISSKELRGIVLTKEDWVLSFLDKAGYYHPEKLEADKHYIEQFYQNNGYLHAKVTDVDFDMDPRTKHIKLTYEIEEGDQYFIKKVSAPGNELLSEEYLLSQIPIRSGMIYSRERIANTIKLLERVWGDQGYIFAHIEPSIQPDEDTKTVDVSFFSELGNKVLLNKITIRGNKKTRDKIIRRKIMLEEGDLITRSTMNASKRTVESLGYFVPREGVNWKIRRIAQDRADLDLMIKESKTGHFGAQIGFGGAGADLGSPASGFTFKADVSDTNLFGGGINFNLSASWSKDEKTALFHIAQPWLFDKPVLGALDIYHKRPSFNELFNIDLRAVHEKLTGASLTAGYITRSIHEILHDMQILGSVGIESIRYERQPIATISRADEKTTLEFQSILDKEFTPGNFAWISANFQQDTRNHPIHPSRGHRWKLTSKFAIPSFGDDIGYYRVSWDANWFTPLIGEHDLVLRLHSYFGFAGPFKNRIIPYGELFHIGGHNSVRGFLFGQIGPKFLGDTIGASKAIFFNVELIFPITGDMSMKGVVFYDGGTGFDNPYVQDISRENITGNNFDYRHSVGVGMRLLRPMPIKIDWGFKIDPRKNKKDPSKSETGSELHFGMSYDW